MASRDPQLLELRIHGVSNTPPAEMLGVTPDQVRQISGDSLGSFWTTTQPPAGDVRTEAYSWGSMARNGARPILLLGQLVVHVGWLLLLPFGLCNVAYWMRKIEHQDSQHTWRPGRGAATLRLFGLGLTLLFTCSILVVTAELFGVRCALPGLRDALPVCAQVNGALGAVGVDAWPRGLRVTLFALVPVLAASALLYLCARARVRYELNIVGEVRRDNREAELPTPQHATPSPTETPVLASTGFWLHARVATATERLHFAAVVFLVALVVFLDRIFLQDPACRTARAVDDALCPFRGDNAAGADLPLLVPTVGAALALVGLIMVGVLVWAVTETKVDPRRVLGQRSSASRLVWGAALLLIGAGVLSAFPSPDGTDGRAVPLGLMGLTFMSAAVACFLLAIAVSALGWRRGVPVWVSTPLILITLAAPLLPSLLPTVDNASSWAVALGSVGLVLQLLATALWPRPRQQRRTALTEGWRGAGPGVVMLVALGVAMTLSALVIVGAVTWVEAGCVGVGCADVGQPHLLPVPEPFAAFALWLLVGVVCVVLLLGWHVVLLLRRLHLLTTPPVGNQASRRGPARRGQRRRRFGRNGSPSRDTDPESSARPPESEPIEGLRSYGAAPPPVADTTDEIGIRILTTRRLAALSHRGEPALGLLSAFLGLAVGASLLSSIPAGDKHRVVAQLDGAIFRALWNIDVLAPVTDWTSTTGRALSLAALAVIAAAVLGVIAANALTTQERPIGVLWDLISFLPRAGHPFAPPCYAERAVPEINQRIRDWFDDDDGPGVTEGARGPTGHPAAGSAPRTRHAGRHRSSASSRRLILSAHSLGAVLAVASLFALYPGRQDLLARIGLITYGIQLRAYFGRFFPELFGPAVLGTRPTLAPTLRGADPWYRQVVADERDAGREEGRSAHPVSLLTVLPSSARTGRPAWVSLWRRTDHLGFPANSFSPNAIDRGTSEFESASYLLTIATHSRYPDTAQYAAALAEVRRRLDGTDRHPRASG